MARAWYASVWFTNGSWRSSASTALHDGRSSLRSSLESTSSGNNSAAVGIQAAIKTIRWFHEQAPNTPIILVGHSLGSVVAAQTIASLCATESWMSRVVLVTLGSPLNYISRAFPKSVPPARKLADAICAAGVRWLNLWRLSDPIGKFLDIGRSGTVQDCVYKGGHMDYWSRAAVWQAVAFRLLGIGEGSSEMSGPKACVVERSLGLLVFCSIILLCACGVGLWLLPL
jgi:hypothetical protein